MRSTVSIATEVYPKSPFGNTYPNCVSDKLVLAGNEGTVLDSATVLPDDVVDRGEVPNQVTSPATPKC